VAAPRHIRLALAEKYQDLDPARKFGLRGDLDKIPRYARNDGLCALLFALCSLLLLFALCRQTVRQTDGPTVLTGR